MKEMNKRALAAQPFSFNAYEENYGAVMALCEASGRKPAEELRDLLDEGINARMRRSDKGCEVAVTGAGQPGQSNDDIVQLAQVIQQLVQKASLQNDILLRVAFHLREQYGMVLESVAAGYAARHLIWKYVVEGLLRDEGLSPEQIMQRLDNERRTWNAERDRAADLLEQAIRSLGAGREDGSGSA
ncbi:MAG TPA: hypothetical protein VJ464_10715 [Blastocatellia bacterium]|nr:hypothetical protein [Blastocatellia bacterium]